MSATRALIHLDNFRSNIEEVKRRVGAQTNICAVVKANAYGHGAVRIAKTAVEKGISHLGVATALEGVELRTAGITKPILLLVLPTKEEFQVLVHHNLSPFVADSNIIHLLNEEAVKQNKTIGVHLKVDTGLGRIGCTPGEVHDLCISINDKQGLFLEGVCTHFAHARNQRYTMEQIELFKGIIGNLKQNHIDPGIVHAANSGVVMHSYEQAFFDMVRVGISLYGYCPPFIPSEIQLKPVMSLRTKVIFVKKVNASTPISYGLTYKTEKETQIATLAVGFATGYNSKLSGNASVLINSRNYKICGIIGMNQCMVDIGENPPVNVDDDVTLFGPEDNATTVQDIQNITGTSPYEVLSSVSKSVPRVYL